jgi:predicted alpha/beta hydrolase
VTLALHRHEPLGPRRGAALLVHAMMTSSGYLAPFAQALADEGIDAFRLDLRGHGGSVPPSPRGGRWGFDAYPELDLPAAVAAAARLAGVPPEDLAYVGHSLRGLVGVAGFGSSAAPAPRRLVLVAASPWTSGGPRRLAIAGALAALGAAVGHLPARRLRLGSDDEPAPYLADFARFVATGSFASRAGLDYLAAAARIRTPTLIVVGAGDRSCSPEDARVLAARLGGPRSWRPVGRKHGDAVDAGHMGFFGRALAPTLWRDLARFILT